MTAHYIASHDMTWHHITSHHTTGQHMTWHDMTWHLATNHISWPHITSHPTALLHLISQPTTWRHTTSQHITSPRLTHHEGTTSHHQTPAPDGTAEGWRTQKNSVWASHWLVSQRAFYRQTLSIADRFFPTSNFCPARPGSTGMIMFMASLVLLISLNFAEKLIV